MVMVVFASGIVGVVLVAACDWGAGGGLTCREDTGIVNACTSSGDWCTGEVAV